MKTSSASWLVVLALALFAYIFLYERHTPDTARRDELMGRLIPNLEPATATVVEVIRSNLVLRAERTNGVWSLTVPVRYPAEPAALQKLLEGLTALNRQVSISAADLLAQADGLGAFGLDAPGATISVAYGGKRRVELRLGARSVLGQRVYVQLVGADGLFATDAAFLELLPATAAAWRDRTFVPLQGVAFNRLDVRAGNREFALQRATTNRPWALTRPMSARADNARVNASLRVLLTARVAEFVSDDPVADPDAWGLRTPELELVAGVGTNDVAGLQFGRSPTNAPALVYARWRGQPNVLLVPREAAEPWRAPFTDFRDRHLAEFDPAAVDRLEFQSAESFALERQTNGLWQVIEPRRFAADASLVRETFASFVELEASEFVKDVVADYSAYGLAPAAATWRLLRATTNSVGLGTNVPLVELALGLAQEGRVFARRSDEPFVYAVPQATIARWPAAAFQWRDRRPWKFATSNLTAVVIQLKDQTVRLERNAAQLWTFAAGSQGILNAFALDEALFRLGELTVPAWLAQGEEALTRHGIPETAHALTLTVQRGEGTETLTVRFGRGATSLNPYAAITLEGAPLVFEFPAAVYAIYAEALRGIVPPLTAPAR